MYCFVLCVGSCVLVHEDRTQREVILTFVSMSDVSLLWKLDTEQSKASCQDLSSCKHLCCFPAHNNLMLRILL